MGDGRGRPLGSRGDVGRAAPCPFSSTHSSGAVCQPHVGLLTFVVSWLFSRKETSGGIRIPLSSKATHGSHENFMPNGRMSPSEALHGQEEMGYSAFML